MRSISLASMTAILLKGSFAWSIRSFDYYQHGFCQQHLIGQTSHARYETNHYVGQTSLPSAPLVFTRDGRASQTIGMPQKLPCLDMCSQLYTQCKQVVRGLCLHDMQLTLHNKHKTRGVNNVSHKKTSRDVGMVHCVSETTGSCMEKPTGTKSPRGVSVTLQQPGQHSPHILWIHCHYLYIWQHFDAALRYCPRTHARKIDLNHMWPLANHLIKCIPDRTHTQYIYNQHGLSKR